jgi:phage pi2 protein 07
MEMFSEELYELDRNTVQYMIDEMQDTIDVQKEELEQLRNQLLASIRSSIDIMRKDNLSEEEIVERIMQQYQLTKEQAVEYIRK